MPGAKSGFIAGLLTAAGLAAAAWFLRVRPALDEADGLVREARDAARRASRESNDARHWAETEQANKRSAEDRVRELERALAATANRPPAGGGDRTGERSGEAGAGGHGRTAPDEPAPETWDRTRLNQEIEAAAFAPEGVAKNPRIPLIVKATRSHGADGRDLVLGILKNDLGSGYVAVAAVVAEALGETRATPHLIARFRTESNAASRRLVLRALANIPGEEATPILHEAWVDPASDPMTRALAMQGLAVRGDPVARSAADGTVDVPQPIRARAVEWLRTCAERGAWKDETLVPVFTRALRTASGPAQRKLALVALEGFRSKSSLDDLDAFAADPATPSDLVTRARALAESIRSGAARPENAGQPDRGLIPDDDR